MTYYLVRMKSPLQNEYRINVVSRLTGFSENTIKVFSGAITDVGLRMINNKLILYNIGTNT
ncbi:MAG TPA: hypothetical protein VJP58_07335 [Candidatus Nitrosocosmicus sp.]|nr:hypothetical protein [Candidatus Nitrosocosmicus sp.]